jgi:hypothetical protein
MYEIFVNLTCLFQIQKLAPRGVWFRQVSREGREGYIVQSSNLYPELLILQDTFEYYVLLNLFNGVYSKSLLNNNWGCFSPIVRNLCVM